MSAMRTASASGFAMRHVASSHGSASIGADQISGMNVGSDMSPFYIFWP
jgi:hypothetical protein